jgi:hypothetical protein
LCYYVCISHSLLNYQIPPCLECLPIMARAPKRRNLAAGSESEELQRLLHTGGISLNGLHTLLRRVEPLRRADGTMPGRDSILSANAERLLL